MNMSKKIVGATAAVAAIAVLSSTGGAVAGGLITTAQIKNNAITSAKVDNGTLTLKDFKSSERKKLVGPAGPAGPTGLPGLNASNNTSIVQGPTMTVAAGQIGSVAAACPAGKRVTGGGYFSSIAIAASSQPSNDGSVWGAVINNSDNSTAVQVYAYAVCS